MYRYSKWTWPERTTEEEEEAIADFNEALKENPNPDEVDWIREAAERCPLVETIAITRRDRTKRNINTTPQTTGSSVSAWWPSDK